MECNGSTCHKVLQIFIDPSESFPSSLGLFVGLFDFADFGLPSRLTLLERLLLDPLPDPSLPGDLGVRGLLLTLFGLPLVDLLLRLRDLLDPEPADLSLPCEVAEADRRLFGVSSPDPWRLFDACDSADGLRDLDTDLRDFGDDLREPCEELALE